MAAPPSKPSPSSKEVQQSTDDDMTSLQANKAAASASAPAPQNVTEHGNENTATASSTALDETAIRSPTMNTSSTMVIPTYESSEASEHFLLGKELLSAGDFEQALQIIEQGIEENKAILASLDVVFDLHECMAPFHYLYGTTLLYSIEESNDTQMTMAVGETPAASAEGAEGASASQQEQPQPPNPAVDADDMEIAWENLEAARNILDLLLSQDMPQQRKAKLQSDLAQTLLREADLQRMNGRYTEAIHDYEACLQLRQILLPDYDRKIADAQYNLGLSYLSHSTELQKEDVLDAAKQKLTQDHCRMGIQLYLACAKTMCGQIALLCGVEPEAVLNTMDATTAAATAPSTGGLKTTGMEEHDIANSEASLYLNALRSNVANLSPTVAGDHTVEDLKQLLDEIQETVDEAQRSQDAVRQAAEIKNQAKRAVEAADGAASTTDGSTTTIGFGRPTLTDPADATTTKSPAAAAAAPMMVVKKKKKRPVPSVAPEEDGKQPPQDSKRAKTE